MHTRFVIDVSGSMPVAILNRIHKIMIHLRNADYPNSEVWFVDHQVRQKVALQHYQDQVEWPGTGSGTSLDLAFEDRPDGGLVVCFTDGYSTFRHQLKNILFLDPVSLSDDVIIQSLAALLKVFCDTK